MRMIKAVLVFIIICIIAGVGFLYLAPETTAKLAIGAERRRSGLKRKEINLPGNIHYVYLEDGQGEPLMLLHGFGESGHPQNADYRTSAQAARLRTLAKALGITKLHLGGSSIGGQISIIYASVYPDEVKSLWLLDPGPVSSALPSEFQKMITRTGENPLMARTEDEFVRTFTFAMADQPLIPHPILNVMAQERIRNYDLEKRIFKTRFTDPVEKYVTSLETSALIVWAIKIASLNRPRPISCTS